MNMAVNEFEARHLAHASRGPIVLVIQMPTKRIGPDVRPAFDLSGCEKYGEAVVLAPNGKHILTPDIFRRDVEIALDHHAFNPALDFVITAGDYTVLFFVGMIMAGRYPYVRILRWVPSARDYQPLTLDLRR